MLGTGLVKLARTTGLLDYLLASAARLSRGVSVLSPGLTVNPYRIFTEVKAA
jgi:hypothetical protein